MKLRTVKFLSPGKQPGVMCYNQPEDGTRLTDAPRFWKHRIASILYPFLADAQPGQA